MKLLLASNNPKKLHELGLLLAPLGIEVVTPRDLGGLPDVEEDRPTFGGNAAKKALAGARNSGLWSLADDSGLEVDALDGAPGVLSARYAGEPCDDGRNNAKLLRALAGVPDERRGARFVCALALARPSGPDARPVLVAELEGTARGRILHAPRGDGDFGYDPLFLFTEAGQPGAGATFAELAPEAKSRVSHRGRALASLREQLPALLPHPTPDA